jgi:hypothetical protein
MLATITKRQDFKYMRSGSRLLAIKSGQRIAYENSIPMGLRDVPMGDVPMGLISSAHYFQQALEGIMRNHGILYERVAYDAPEFDSRDDAGEKVLSSWVCVHLFR